MFVNKGELVCAIVHLSALDFRDDQLSATSEVGKATSTATGKARAEIFESLYIHARTQAGRRLAAKECGGGWGQQYQGIFVRGTVRR